MPIKRAKFNVWTGTPTTPVGTKLNIDRNVWRGDYPVKAFNDMAASSDYSNELWFGLELLDAHTKIAKARITKVHGTYQSGHDLYAGTTGTFATPKAAGVVSTIATSKIPTHLKPTTMLELDFTNADNEYKFLVLQNRLGTGQTAYNPAIQEGQAGYPLIQVAFPYMSRDAARSHFPGAKAPESVYNNTGTTIYMIDENGDMQQLGCFDNAVNFLGAPEWEAMVKGAMRGAQSWAFNNRPLALTGTIYSQGVRVMQEFLHGENRGSDGWHTEIVLGTDWKPVSTREILFVTYSDMGRELIVRFPVAAMRATGEIAYGQANTNVPFEIVTAGANLYISDHLLDVHYFSPYITLT